MTPKKAITLLQVILTVANCFVIVSDSSSGSIYGIYFLTFYSSILSVTFYSGILSGIYSDISDILSGILSGISSEFFAGILSDILFGIYSGILSGIYFGILFGIYSDSLFWHSIWHLFWHSILAFYSGIHSGMHSGSLSGILFDILFWHLFWHSLWHGHWDLALAVEVWQCPLRSGARAWGLAVPTEIWSSRWGPAVPTEIWSSRLRPGSAHWDLELAVEVRQCPLRSGARGWGPAVPTEIWSSRLRPGSAHWDLELAVEVRQCPLRSGATLIKSKKHHWQGGNKFLQFSARCSRSAIASIFSIIPILWPVGHVITYQNHQPPKSQHVTICQPPNHNMRASQNDKWHRSIGTPTDWPLDTHLVFQGSAAWWLPRPWARQLQLGTPKHKRCTVSKTIGYHHSSHQNSQGNVGF